MKSIHVTTLQPRNLFSSFFQLAVLGILLLGANYLSAQSAIPMQVAGASAAIENSPKLDDGSTFSFSLTSSPSTLTIPQGSSSSETLTLTPLIGTGSVNLTATVPAVVTSNATGCLTGLGVVSDNLPVSGPLPTKVLLTIYTKHIQCPIHLGSVSIAPKDILAGGRPVPAMPSLPGRGAIAVAGLAFLGILILPRRSFRSLLSIFLLGVLGFTLAGCGGSSSAGLPKGSYPITITASDPLGFGLARTTTFTVLVN